MSDPNGQCDPGEEEAVEQHGQREQPWRALAVEDAKTLALEPKMRHFISQNLLTHRS